MDYVEKGDFIQADVSDTETVIFDNNLSEKISGIVSEINQEKGYIKVYTNNEYKYYNFKFEEKKSLTDLLKVDEKNAEGLYRVGLMYAAQHDIKNAEESFKKALVNKPDLIQAKYNLALLYANNNRDKAKELYIEILEQDPSYEEAKNALADLSTSEYY